MVLAVEPKFLGPDAVFYAVFARSIKVFMHLPLPLALAPSHHAPVGRRELHAQYPRDACCSRNPPLPHRSRHTTRASSPPERLRLLASHRLRSQLRPLPSWGRETHPLRPLLHPCPARARTMRIPICSDARQPSPARSQIQSNVGEGIAAATCVLRGPQAAPAVSRCGPLDPPSPPSPPFSSQDTLSSRESTLDGPDECCNQREHSCNQRGRLPGISSPDPSLAGASTLLVSACAPPLVAYTSPPTHKHTHTPSGGGSGRRRR